MCQVGRRDDLDRDPLVNAVDANLDGRPAPHRRSRRTAGKFFVHKAIGWALRDHARTDPEWVRTFVADREARLSGLSRREALRHLG